MSNRHSAPKGTRYRRFPSQVDACADPVERAAALLGSGNARATAERLGISYVAFCRRRREGGQFLPGEITALENMAARAGYDLPEGFFSDRERVFGMPDKIAPEIAVSRLEARRAANPAKRF